MELLVSELILAPDVLSISTPSLVHMISILLERPLTVVTIHSSDSDWPTACMSGTISITLGEGTTIFNKNHHKKKYIWSYLQHCIVGVLFTKFEHMCSDSLHMCVSTHVHWYTYVLNLVNKQLHYSITYELIYMHYSITYEQIHSFLLWWYYICSTWFLDIMISTC